jgi:hypothetical protein
MPIGMRDGQDHRAIRCGISERSVGGGWSGLKRPGTGEAVHGTAINTLAEEDLT